MGSAARAAFGTEAVSPIVREAAQSRHSLATAPFGGALASGYTRPLIGQTHAAAHCMPLGRAYMAGSAQNQKRRASLTPGPPPFSEINSMPAASSALRIAFRLAKVVGGMPSSDSARLTVATPTLAASARSFALQRTSARAARIWAPVISFRSCDCKVISGQLKGHDRLAASAARNDPGPC